MSRDMANSMKWKLFVTKILWFFHASTNSIVLKIAHLQILKSHNDRLLIGFTPSSNYRKNHRNCRDGVYNDYIEPNNRFCNNDSIGIRETTNWEISWCYCVFHMRHKIKQNNRWCAKTYFSFPSISSSIQWDLFFMWTKKKLMSLIVIGLVSNETAKFFQIPFSLNGIFYFLL